jgi:hypothetical protein
LKRKEIKKIKEHFTKEKENYLNIPKILNELVSKLKEDIDKIINNISNEIKFKESIINTYESKLDNYNAIINFKNLKFNTEPFTVNKDLNNLENIIELIKYLNLNETKANDEKKDNLQKSSDKIKLKKKKVVSKSGSSKKVNKNNSQTKVNEANNNNVANENAINKENNTNNVENENNKEPINNNSSKSNEKVYKKNFIQKKINNNNINNNNNNTNNINVENSKKNLNKITEDESSNNQNNTNNNLTQSKDIQETTNKKEEVSIPPSKNEKEENKEIENMKQKNNTITNNINNTLDNISKNIKNKVTSNSTNNINYVRPESNIKLPVRSNKSIHFDKNVDFKNRNQSKEMLSQHSKSQKSFTSITNDPMTLIKQLNENKLPLENISKQQKIINNNRIIENKNREKKIMDEMKKMNMKQNNKKLREEYDDDDEDLDEEEEEEEDDEDEEDEEEEDSESDESEEDEKIVKKNRFKNSQKSDRILVKEEEDDYGNLNINKEMAMEENDTSFRHKKIYPRSSLSTDNVELSELFTRKKNLQNMKNNLGNNLNEKNQVETKTKIRIIRDMTINEFKPNSSTLKIKESDNMVCCMLEVRDNIFACGFLLGQIDVYDIISFQELTLRPF